MRFHTSLALLVEGRRRETFARWSNGKVAVAEMRPRTFQGLVPGNSRDTKAGAAPAGGARNPALGRPRPAARRH